MRIGKIVVTIACSLLMSGVALAEIIPTPANSPVPGLSIASERISAVGEDYGKVSTILNSFYDNFTGKVVMSKQTPVYIEWNFGEDKKSLALTQEKSNIVTKPRNSIVPSLDGNKSDSRSIFEESLRGRTKDVHNWSNTITYGGTGAAAGAVAGLMHAVAGGAVGVIAGARQDWKETEAQIERDEERYQNGTNAWNAAKRDQLRRKKENG